MWIIDHLFNLRGVDAKTPVVVYDDQSGMRAARAFWFLEYFGHPRVQVLDGGFGAWISAGLPVTREAAPPPKSSWTGTPQEHTIATWRDVKDRLGQSRRRHSRHAQRRASTTARLVRAKRGGAIPGAVHVEWTRNLGPDGAFKPAARAARDVRGRRRHARQGSRHLLPGRLPRRARAISRCACSAIRACAITPGRGRSGAIARICRLRRNSATGAVGAKGARVRC